MGIQKYSEIILMFSISINGKILYVSGNCEQLLGYKREEIIGSSIKKLIHIDDDFMLESHFFNPNHDGNPFNFRMKTRTNQYVWFETEIHPIYQSVNYEYDEINLKMTLIQESSYVECEKNINDHPTELNYPNNLKEYVKNYGYDLVKEAPFPIIISKHGELSYLNDSARKLLGINSDSVISSLSIFAFIDEEFHPIVKKRIELLQKGQQVGLIEQKWVRADGTIINVEVRSVPIQLENESFSYTVIHDISSRKAFESIIHRSRERYQRIVQNSIDTIAVIYKHNWVFINDSGVRMFGAKNFSDIIGKSIFEFLEVEHYEKIKEFIEAVTNEKNVVNFRHQPWILNNGSIIHTELIGIPTTYYGENAVQVIIRDISDRLNAEELMIKSEKLSIAGQLAAGIAHEIRNPLTAIKGFLQLLHLEFQEKQQYFDIILSELNRIERILSELLLLAKPTVVKYVQVDVRAILHDVITLLDTQAILKNTQIIFESVDENAIIQCDVNQIKQVFINLIKNAIDAMKSTGGKVIITLSLTQTEIFISFNDNGCGIPSTIIDRIGEPFYTTKEKGTGLGLMVSYNIIENHNGEITVESVENEGTTFVIKLPRVQKV